MDTFRFRGQHQGDLGYKSRFYGTHQACPHSGWTWKGHLGSDTSEKSKNHTHTRSGPSLSEFPEGVLIGYGYSFLGVVMLAASPARIMESIAMGRAQRVLIGYGPGFCFSRCHMSNVVVNPGSSIIPEYPRCPLSVRQSPE